jgi:hypothetical protein
MPRLLIQPKQVGKGAIPSVSVSETWEELHQWMRWTENRGEFTVELMEARNRHVLVNFSQKALMQGSLPLS